jgi:uncharacterized protein YeaO (DUF488 family)
VDGSQLKRKTTVGVFRIGDEPRRGEGLRIGTTRYPPRGVPRSRWRKDQYFDVWFPVVAPSEKLLRSIRKTGLDDAKTRRRFFGAYRRELKRPPASHAVELLAALAAATPIAVGCFCADETRCHRSVLREEIDKRRVRHVV